MAVHPVQFLAACQAPGPAYHLVAPVADPEPGWALLAVDAELQGAQRPAGRDHHGRLSGCWFACGQPVPLMGWQPVRRHPEAVTRGAAHHDVIDGAVRAGEGKAFGDLGRDGAVRARYGGQHCSASGVLLVQAAATALPVKKASGAMQPVAPLAGVVMPMPPGAATGPGARRAGMAGGGARAPSAGGGQHWWRLPRPPPGRPRRACCTGRS
jgi:hypothetical protein